MTEKIVTVEIDEQGNSSIDLAGFQGKGCGDVGRALQGADAITKSQTKREFYVDALVRQNQQQKQ